MKKKTLTLLFTAMVAAAMCFGCGNTDVAAGGDTASQNQPEVIDFSDIENGTAGAGEDAAAPEADTFEVPEGMYESELTGEFIDEALEDQRPCAFMVDNESTALDHYGVNSADIVYEMVNSTANGRITRLMCIVKDWQNLEQFGNIRSTRPTNIVLSGEYNAILVHDGGPAIYVDPYFTTRSYVNHLSGGFARFTTGKADFYSEYVTSEGYTNPNTGNSYAGLLERIDKAGFSTTYNEYYRGRHFTFDHTSDGVNLEDYGTVTEVTHIDLSGNFPHNGSELKYNEETKKYEYWEYGREHIDPLDDNKVTSFENVIIYEAPLYQYDTNGYMFYPYMESSGEGYFITEGKCVKITWVNENEMSMTHFYAYGSEVDIPLNVGKTYIALCPEDTWDKLVLE